MTARAVSKHRRVCGQNYGQIHVLAQKKSPVTGMVTGLFTGAVGGTVSYTHLDVYKRQVLAGTHSKHGIQFVTWDRDYDRTDEGSGGDLTNNRAEVAYYLSLIHIFTLPCGGRECRQQNLWTITKRNTIRQDGPSSVR